MKKILTIICIIAVLSGIAFATPAAYVVEAIEPSAVSAMAKSTIQVDKTVFGILGLIAFGDASIEGAKQSAGIKEIKYIDKNTFSLFNLFVMQTYTIYGN